MTSSTITLTDTNFEVEVLKSKLPVIVDFWAEWCGPCKQIAPSIEELAKEFAGQLKFGKMDIDTEQKIAQEYSVKSIPTLLIFKGGSVIGQFVGAVSKAKLKAEIKKYLED